MIFETAKMSAQQIYHATTQTLLPRPIAWVLTKHSSGHFNLAPFSYFTAVSSDPPLLVFSVGDKTPGEGKDTKVNIRSHPYFTIHIPSLGDAAAVTETAATLAAEESELVHAGLETVPFEGFDMPRLANCSVAYGCRLHDIQDIKGAPQSLVFAHIEQIYISPEVAQLNTVRKSNGDTSERLVVDASKLNPLARLGGAQYAGIGAPFEIERPK